MFRGTFKFDSFYFNYMYHIEANQINFSPFSLFELRTPGVHYSVPHNVDLGTVVLVLMEARLSNITVNFRYRNSMVISLRILSQRTAIKQWEMIRVLTFFTQTIWRKRSTPSSCSEIQPFRY